MFSKYELEDLLFAATSAALKAGTYIIESSQSLPPVQTKSGGSSLASQVFTEIDIKSEQIILDALFTSCARFDLGVLAEESEDCDERFYTDAFWAVDPLDGTLPFLERQNGYSISIALVTQKGEPLVGVIFDPLTETLYSAIKGQGAFKNGKPFGVKKETEHLTVVMDRSFAQSEKAKEFTEKLKSWGMNRGITKLNTICHGGAAMNALWTIEQAPAIYAKFPKEKPGGGSIWDFAASSLIVSEAGGSVSSMIGTPLDLNRKDSTFMNHQGVLYCSDSDLYRFVLETA